MIGIMEKTLEEGPPEKEEVSTPKQKKADIKTPSITSFFKPTPQAQENKTSDLRSYFQVSKKDVPDQLKISSDKHCHEESSAAVEKTNIVDAGNVEGNTFSVKEKLKRSKQEGEGKRVSKKSKKQKGDSHHKSDDDDQDFESPPRSRRKRKSRLDSDSIADFITEDSKQSQDLSENACMEPCTRDEMEVCEMDSAEMPCNGEGAMNTSTVVSYEDFLRMEDEDGGESDIETKEDAETADDVEIKNSDSTLQGEGEHVSELVMLTPPDSRCSQESPEDDQPATPPAKQDTKKVEEATDSDTSLRKVITVKAQVHSPIDGRDKDSTPSTPLMLGSDHISRKQGFSSPKRLISNVSVLDSSPELTLISVETKEEPRKIGPVYSIFQPKSCLKKELTKKEAIKENKQDETVKDLSKKEVKDTDGGDKEKRTKEKQEASVDKQDVVNKQEVDKSDVKGKEEKKRTTKKDTLTRPDKTVKQSTKVSVVENESASVKDSSTAINSSKKSKSVAKNKEEKESEEGEPTPTRRVLRARVTKKSTDPDSSLDEFDDIKPLKRKADKQIKKVTTSSNKASAKAEVKGQKKVLVRSKSSEPPRFKSSLMDGSKGQGSIKLKLTAIKASPKKNSKVSKAQQLLQKAKKGHQTTLGTKTQTSRQLLMKKNTQTTFPESKSAKASDKVEKTNSLNKKGKMEQAKGKPGKVPEKKNGDSAPKQTPRRRSSSRNKPKTPPKPAAKLAPIFTKQGQLAAAKKFKQESIMAAIAADSIPADEASRDSLTDSRDTTSDLGGPVLGFNMLEQLKMETTLPQRDTSMQLTEVCHVLQKDDTSPLWNLPSPGLANWKLCQDLEPVPKTGQNLKLTTHSISSLPSSYIFKLSEGHPPVNESDKKAVMDEILKANPKFPVQKVFKMYQAKRNGETQKKEEDKSDIQATDQANREAAASSEGVPSGKGSRLSRGKRKAEDVDDEETNTRRKMARRSGRGCARRSLEASLDDGPSDGGTGAGGPGEERSLRRSSRRSSRRLSKMEEMEDNQEGDGKEEEKKVEEKEGKKDTVVEESQEEKRRAGMLWTEKYQPSAVSEMIGNSTICKKFSSWLTEWKKKTQRMKEKTRNAQGKDKRRSKGSRRIDSDDESDDDFCCDDSDDSDEEDGLCNTILLSGPHGVGKTSLVYACAQELGFEVFEVNASSRRNGRQILSELGEGTQSHQVARQPGLSSASFFNPSPTKSGSAKMASPKKKKPALPKAFAGFVKMGSSSSKRSPVKKPSAKKSPKKSVKQSPIKKSSSSQLSGSQAGISKSKVTSTSLILFDEVDVIFEEDKGFLSTVMSFMESSKRPIVLTTSDPRFSFCLTSRYDELIFKPPPLNALVSHLKLLCLAEDVPISHQDLKLVIEFFDRDIRRCLQHLQFWVCSGAMPERGATQQESAGKDGGTGLLVNALKENREELPVAMSDTSDMDTSDMKGDESSMKGVMEELTLELIDLETRIIAVGEYYSMKGYKPQDVLKMMEDMGLMSKQETSTDTCNESNSIQEILRCSYRTGLGNYCGLFESIAGLGNIAGPVIDSLHLLKKLDDPALLAAVLKAFHNLNIDAAHCSLPQILSSLTTSKDTRERNASPSSNHKPSNESPDHEMTEKEKQKISRLGGDLIDVMAEHAERMSAMDTLLPHDQRQDSHLNRYGGNEWWHPLLMPGLNDNEDWTGDDYELTDVRPCDSRSEHNIADVNCYLEAMCLRDCVRRCQRTIVEARQGEARWEEIQHSVLPSFDESCIQIQDIKFDATLRETNSAVVRRLPDYLYTNHSALTLDYLPMLRGICRFEELRKEANLKRRFFHYLDSISFCLKAVTHLSLASILNPTQRANVKPSL